MYRLNIIKITSFSLIILLFIACSQKTTIKALKPSLVSDNSIKNITIKIFQNDNISLASIIESKMDKIVFNDIKYFNIVNRKDINLILKELSIKDSGLVDIKDDEQFALSDVNSILTGKINSTNYSMQPFYEYRINYNRCKEYNISKSGKKYCSKYYKYKVVCHHHYYNVDATISIIKVIDATIIYNDNFSIKKSIKTCMDSSRVAPQSLVVYKEIAQKIANEFVSKIAPSYQYFNVILIENEDIDYSSFEENLLENGLKMIELGNIKSANKVFKSLVTSTKYQSSTALYNLATTEESFGNLEKAYELYKRAEDISLYDEINENITKAVNRVRITLKDKQKAMVQIDK